MKLVLSSLVQYTLPENASRLISVSTSSCLLLNSSSGGGLLADTATQCQHRREQYCWTQTEEERRELGKVTFRELGFISVRPSKLPLKVPRFLLKSKQVSKEGD